MRITLKYVGLIIGMALSFISFLFFGRQQDTYQIILITGLLVSALFFATILFGRHSSRSKIIVVIFVLLSALLQQLFEPLLIDTSYKTFIKQNRDPLVEINEVLSDKPGEIFIL